jgi:triosephosphate isomerase
MYVANWKMNFSFNQSTNFCTNNNNALQKLASTDDIVVCPSFDALAPINNLLKNTDIMIGAQNCSEYALGAYTGEVSALSLAEIGVNYCIVGHSERRIHYGETTEQIVKKIYLLYAANIIPIICIGETHNDFIEKKTVTVLEQQLQPILAAITQQEQKKNHIIIAYEPVWAIGTNIIPEQEQLIDVFTQITNLVHAHLPNHTIQLLYGGSVNQNNSAQLKKIPHINGFLIGGASTQFDQFKNIITTD